MRPLTTIFAVSGFAALLLGAAIVTLAIELLPYVAIGCAIAVLIKSRHRFTDTANQPPYRAALTPQPQIVTPPGWVYVPVWVGSPPPRRPSPVIDAKVIEEPQ